MNCPFCKKPGLPQFNAPHSGGLFHVNSNTETGAQIEFWLCPNCPALVEFDESAYSLYCQFNSNWYEIVWLKLSKQYLVYHLKSYVKVDEEAGTESYYCKRELAVQVESEENINPANAKEKLATLINF